jgi:hypothetical protein
MCRKGKAPGLQGGGAGRGCHLPLFSLLYREGLPRGVEWGAGGAPRISIIMLRSQRSRSTITTSSGFEIYREPMNLILKRGESSGRPAVKEDHDAIP